MKLIENLIIISIITILLFTSLQHHHKSSVASPEEEDSKYLQWQQAVEGSVRDMVHYKEANNREAILVATGSNQLRSYDAENGSLLWEYQVNNATVRFNDLHTAKLYSNETDYLFAYGHQFSDPIPGYEEAGLTGTYYLFNLHTKELIQTFYSGSYIDKIRTGYIQSTNQPKIVLVSHRLVDNPNLLYLSELLVMDISSQTIIFNHTITDWNTPYSDQIGIIFNIELKDLDHDGYDEIVVTKSLKNNVSTRDSFIEAYDGVTLELLWNYTNREINFPKEMKFHEITEDDTLDIVCTDGGKGIYAVDGATGATLWSLSEVGGNCCAIKDLDQDGDIEVITFHLENLSIIDINTGKMEYSTITPFSHNSLVINVTDINHDGQLEIISSSFYGNVYVFNATGSVLFKLPTNGPAFSTSVIDIGNDGITEIVTGTMVNNGMLSVFQIPNASNNNQSIPVNILMLVVPLIITMVGLRIFSKKNKRTSV